MPPKSHNLRQANTCVAFPSFKSLHLLDLSQSDPATTQYARIPKNSQLLWRLIASISDLGRAVHRGHCQFQIIYGSQLKWAEFDIKKRQLGVGQTPYLGAIKAHPPDGGRVARQTCCDCETNGDKILDLNGLSEQICAVGQPNVRGGECADFAIQSQCYTTMRQRTVRSGELLEAGSPTVPAMY